jgi:hypothetical protein
MTRSFETLDLVTLPRLDAGNAVALAQLIETTAAVHENLPPMLTSALVDVAFDREALQKVIGVTPVVTVTVKEADRAEDTAVVALVTLLFAWGKLAAYLPEGQAAHQAQARLFGSGLEFVNYKVEKEWAIVDSKLKTIDDPNEGLLPVLQSIGAMPMLDHLRRVHAQYGEVIGTTKPAEESPEIGEKRQLLLDAMRTYIVRVVGSVERGKPETKARAEALLRPVVEWRGSPAAPKPAPGDMEEEGATPAGA